MRLKTTDKICGYPAKKVRDFLRAHRQYVFWPKALEEFFKIDEGAAKKLYQDFLAEQLIGLKPEHKDLSDPENHITVIEKGIRISAANFTKPFSREVAERLISELIERAKFVNQSDVFLEEVQRIYAFGSYITDSPDFADLDLIIDYQPKKKYAADYTERAIEMAANSGRSFSNSVDFCYFSERQMKRFLKNRSPRYSFHYLDEVEKMKITPKLIWEADSVS